MIDLDKIITLIKFPQKELELNFTHKIEKDIMGFTELKKVQFKNEYIDYYTFRYRNEIEFWNSIDIYIETKKENELIEKLLLKKIDFEDIENNENIYSFTIDNTDSVNIIKFNDRMIIQINKFIK